MLLMIYCSDGTMVECTDEHVVTKLQLRTRYKRLGRTVLAHCVVLPPDAVILVTALVGFGPSPPMDVDRFRHALVLLQV